MGERSIFTALSMNLPPCLMGIDAIPSMSVIIANCLTSPEF